MLGLRRGKAWVVCFVAGSLTLAAKTRGCSLRQSQRRVLHKYNWSVYLNARARLYIGQMLRSQGRRRGFSEEAQMWSLSV
jgi:hypothetical protein